MDTMKHSKLTLALKTAAIIGTVSLFTAPLFLTGCITKSEDSSYASDGQSAYMTSELDQMGQAYDGASAGAAKGSVGIGTNLTVTGELVIDPFTYHEDCTCFVRRAKYTTLEGFERIRLDSVRLFDSTGATLSKFQPALISKITHSRNVTKSKGDKDADIRFDITVDIKTESGAKVGVWNGTMTGSYDGQPFKSGTLTNIVRPWENGRFRFPTAGTIEVDRPVFHFLVEFLGDGKAKVTIKNKLNGKIHILFVDKDYKETAPQDQP
jgi:hypothetical protein